MNQSLQLEKGVPLPSPSLLKGKIVIKNKRLASDVEKSESGHGFYMFDMCDFVVVV